MSTYQYYYRNFLTFFLLSSFCYQNSFLIPQLAGIKLFLSCYNIKRLRASVELNYLSFLSSFWSKIYYTHSKAGLMLPGNQMLTIF